MKKKQTEHQIDQDRSAIDQKFSSVLKETEIPDALKPENISSLIENNKPAEKSKVITNIHFYRLSFALLLIIVMPSWTAGIPTRSPRIMPEPALCPPLLP